MGHDSQARHTQNYNTYLIIVSIETLAFFNKTVTFLHLGSIFTAATILYLYLVKLTTRVKLIVM